MLDIMFEGHDRGWQFLTLSRLDRQLCRVPVILCTAAMRTVREMADHLLREIEARLGASKRS